MSFIINPYAFAAAGPFVDDSGNNRVATIISPAAISAAQSKFGGKSGDFQSSGRIWYANGSWFLPGASDFTVDCWIRFTGSSTDSYVGGAWTGDNKSWLLGNFSQGAALRLVYTTDGSTELFVNGTTATWSVDTWYHIAFVQSAGNLMLYRDGTREANVAAGGALYGGTSTLVFGGYLTAGGQWPGYMDELRVSNVARWNGASFTVPTSAYSADANTMLLLHMDV